MSRRSLVIAPISILRALSGCTIDSDSTPVRGADAGERTTRLTSVLVPFPAAASHASISTRPLLLQIAVLLLTGSSSLPVRRCLAR